MLRRVGDQSAKFRPLALLDFAARPPGIPQVFNSGAD
jgi:hypothetical protein